MGGGVDGVGDIVVAGVAGVAGVGGGGSVGGGAGVGGGSVDVVGGVAGVRVSYKDRR